MAVKVLDEIYDIIYESEETCEDLKGLGGFTNFEDKYIVINKKLKSLDMAKRRSLVIRHEIIHAFLYESGLDTASWARNEEIVDWFALQYPKIRTVLDIISTKDMEVRSNEID